MTLVDLDADLETGGVLTPAQLRGLPCPEVQNGFYTLTFPCGTHRTFRLRTEQHGNLAGTRTLALLVGPDNGGDGDYESFAELTPAGFRVWKRFANQRQAVHAMILWDLLRGVDLDGHELLRSGRCLVCNRMLTDAESIRTGVGPVCRKRMAR